MKGKLIGYHRFTSKKNKNFCVATIVVPCTERELANDYVGSKTEDVFLPDNLYDLLKPKDIGKDVEIDYAIVGGRAFVDDFRVL